MSSPSATISPTLTGSGTRWDDIVTRLVNAVPASAPDEGDLGVPRGLVTALLAGLDPPPGATVLVIGDGTPISYLATAALCAALGPRAVTLVEGSADAVSAARSALGHTGYRPTLVAGRGLHGWQGTAPHDGILSLLAPWRLPGTWIAQTRRGGRILTSLGSIDATVFRLRVADDLHDATGPAIPVGALPGVFRPLNPPNTLGALTPDGLRAPTGATEPPSEATRLNALVRTDPNFGRLLDLALPDVDHRADPTGGHTWIDRAEKPSWAILTRAGQLRGAGPRRLTDQLRDLASWWTAVGMPHPGSWTLTAQCTGAHTLHIQGTTGADLHLPDLPELPELPDR